MRDRFDRGYVSNCLTEVFTDEQIDSLKCINNNVITLKQLHRDLPVKYFCWFLLRHCDMYLDDRRGFVVYCAESALGSYDLNDPIFANALDCVRVSKSFISGRDNIDSLRDAAYLVSKDITDDYRDVLSSVVYAAHSCSYFYSLTSFSNAVNMAIDSYGDLDVWDYIRNIKYIGYEE